MKAHEARFLRDADANPQGYERYIQQRLGVSSVAAEMLFDMHGRLGRGGTLSKDDVATIAHIYRNQIHPRDVATIANGLNESSPTLRPRYFLALISGDAAVLQDRVDQAGQDYRDLDKLSGEYHKFDTVAAIEAKRNAGRVDGSVIAPRRPAEDPTSIRASIERQMAPPGARGVADALEQGQPDVTRLVQGAIGEKMSVALEALDPDAEGVSTRGSLAAAFDFHEGESLAKEEGWLPEDDE